MVFPQVARVLGLNNVIVRAGCVCNPGACQRFLCVSDSEVRKNHSVLSLDFRDMCLPMMTPVVLTQMGHVCWDGNDIVDGRPIGVVRASFGFITRRCDIDAMIHVLRTFYFSVLTAEVDVKPASPLWVAPASLGGITIYPVKSCNGFSVLEWPLGPCGLLYDREWCITDAKGLALTQKAEPKLVSIHARVDVGKAVLILSADGFDSISIPVAAADHGSDAGTSASLSSMDVTVCGEECRGIPINTLSQRASAVNEWLSRVLDRPSMLVRRVNATESDKGTARVAVASGFNPTTFFLAWPGRGKHGTVGFANDAQFLMVSEDSTRDLQDKIIGRYLTAEQKRENEPLLLHLTMAAQFCQAVGNVSFRSTD